MAMDGHLLPRNADLHRRVQNLLDLAAEVFTHADKVEFAGMTYQAEPIIAVYSNGKATLHIPAEID